MNKRLLAAAVAAAAAALTITGAAAYFTDYKDAGFSATAATLKIRVADQSRTDRDGDGLLTPGERGYVRFKVSNEGSVSADLKAVITITSSVELTDGNWEYTLHEGTESEDGIVNVAPGTPCANEDRKVLTYEAVLGTLNGSAQKEEGIGSTEGIYNMDFLFSKTAASGFMGEEAEIHYTIYAKQHRNTTDAEWSELAEYEASV